jgi:hypothetical protein
MTLADEITKLKKEKRAIVLAHNYQRPEIQDMADYVGDSIELSRKAMEEKEAETIVFSAVDFMAESAAILNPDKKVLLPTLGARCPMAQMLTVDEIKRSKRLYPHAPVVLYVNTLATAKANCDICCTSANAVKVIESLDAETVLSGPDWSPGWNRDTGCHWSHRWNRHPGDYRIPGSNRFAGSNGISGTNWNSGSDRIAGPNRNPGISRFYRNSRSDWITGVSGRNGNSGSNRDPRLYRITGYYG